MICFEVIAGVALAKTTNRTAPVNIKAARRSRFV